MRHTLLAFCALISCVFDPALEPVWAQGRNYVKTAHDQAYYWDSHSMLL